MYLFNNVGALTFASSDTDRGAEDEAEGMVWPSSLPCHAVSIFSGWEFGEPRVSATSGYARRLGGKPGGVGGRHGLAPQIAQEDGQGGGVKGQTFRE